MTTALILCPDDKGSLEALGIPLARRLALLLQQTGLCVHLSGGKKEVRGLLSDIIPAGNFHAIDDGSFINLIPPSERVLVIRSNVVIDRLNLDRLLHSEAERGFTFMRTRNANDMICMTKPAHALDVLSPGRQIPEGAQEIPGLNGLPFAIKGPDSIREAEDRLMTALAGQTKSGDGFLARHISRRISQPVTRRLVHTSVTPNQVTMFGMSAGLLAALFLSTGQYLYQLFGSFLFVLCVIIDGIDGEIARLKFQESVFGHYLDIITDNIVHLAIFAGIGAGLYRASGNTAFIAALGALVLGFGLCIVVVNQCLLSKTPEALQRSPKLVRISALMSNRDFAYLVFVLALIGRLDWFLFGSAVGSFIFAATLYFFSRGQPGTPELGTAGGRGSEPVR